MKYFLSTLIKIILRIHSPSSGRVPRFRDLWNKKAKLGMTSHECVVKNGIPLMSGMQDAIDNESVSGKVDNVAAPFDYEIAENNSIEQKEPLYYTSSGFELTALKCKCCGGQIDRRSGICSFCDTQYDIIEKSESYAVLYADDEIVEIIKC